MTRPIQQEAGTFDTQYDLRSDETIKSLFSRYQAEPRASGYHQWQEDLVSFLNWVANSPPSERKTVQFQQRLWNENKVSSVGRGSIPVDAAIEDSTFRDWLAQISMEPVPNNPEEALAYFDRIYEGILERLTPYCPKTPRLKIFRVLAALFPQYFTTISDGSVLMRVHKAMFDTTGGGPVARHLNIVRRLQEVLGPTPVGLQALVERMTFAWYLAERIDVEENRPIGPPGAQKLIPLPATRRQRSLAGTGNMALVMSTLEFVREGVTKDELMAFMRSQEPGKKDNSLAISINVLRQNLHVIRLDGNRYVLSPTGESLLESDDPSVLAPWFITQILGVDHALTALRDQGSQSRSDLVAKIKLANPGWKTDWTPISILSWLRGIGLIEITEDRSRVTLTDLGKEWAARIDWSPQNLPREEESTILSTSTSVQPRPATSLPPFDQIYQRVSSAGKFDREFVATLHAGIWAHARRHFAVMTGLSGAGKTLLGIEYAKAITAAAKSADEIDRVCILPVQPGWSDASALLGYVNPLRPDTYVRVPFLDFLLACTSDPQNPYVAILDEMNLSHPEQYLAPLLSAMETGGYIELHREDDILDGVPSRIDYPNNLVLIGTVNMDETTHGLSDKVLDRAFTLEFWHIDVDAYPRWDSRNIPKDIETSVRTTLKGLINALAPARLHFGWRVIDDVLDFMRQSLENGAGLNPRAALDAVVYAKVLPKLRGEDSQRFREALQASLEVLQANGLEISAARVENLIHDVTTTGTARYWR